MPPTKTTPRPTETRLVTRFFSLTNRSLRAVVRLQNVLVYKVNARLRAVDPLAVPGRAEGEGSTRHLLRAPARSRRRRKGRVDTGRIRVLEP